MTRTLDLAGNEIKILIPITLLNNPDYFENDIHDVTIKVGVDINQTLDITHNISLVQSAETIENPNVPSVLNVRFFFRHL